MIKNTYELDSASVRRLTRLLKEAEETSVAELRNDLKVRILPLGNEVARKVPTESPFIGMARNRNGRVTWGQPKAKVSVTPGRSTRQKGWASMVTIILENKKQLGFSYTENAGPRRKKPRPMARSYKRGIDSAVREEGHLNNGQGDALIRKAKKVSKFNFKAGHFAYGHFLKLRPVMISIAQNSLNQFAKKFSVKLGRR